MKKNLAPSPEILNSHYQLHQKSCIPMAVEYVLKEEGEVPFDFFDYQKKESNSDDSDWVPNLPLKNIQFERRNHLSPKEQLALIDAELNQGRRVIIARQNLDKNGGWHMFAIYEKRDDGQYNLVTSLPANQVADPELKGKSWIEVKDLEKELPIMNDVGLIIYKRNDK